MRKHLLAAAAVALGLGVAMPAQAAQCPADMAKIDAALAQDHQLSDAQLAEVERLREEGERLHDAGQHQESVEALAQAMAILDIQ